MLQRHQRTGNEYNWKKRRKKKGKSLLLPRVSPHVFPAVDQTELNIQFVTVTQFKSHYANTTASFTQPCAWVREYLISGQINEKAGLFSACDNFQ